MKYNMKTYIETPESFSSMHPGLGVYRELYISKLLGSGYYKISPAPKNWNVSDLDSRLHYTPVIELANGWIEMITFYDEDQRTRLLCFNKQKPSSRLI